MDGWVDYVNYNLHLHQIIRAIEKMWETGNVSERQRCTNENVDEQLIIFYSNANTRVDKNVQTVNTYCMQFV